MDVTTALVNRSEFLCASVAAVATILGIIWACVIVGRRRATSGSGAESVGGRSDGAVVPESVNYHLTRQCNYKCGFCFHTAKTSFVLKLEDATRGLKLLREAGKSLLPLYPSDLFSDVVRNFGFGKGLIPCPFAFFSIPSLPSRLAFASFRPRLSMFSYTFLEI